MKSPIPAIYLIVIILAKGALLPLSSHGQEADLLLLPAKDHFFKKDTIKLTDSVITYTWSEPLGYWDNDNLDLYYYDNNTDLIKWNRKNWDIEYGFIWYDDSQTLYTLHNRLVTEELTQDYDLSGQKWINTSLITYLYDGQGNKTERKWQKWNTGDETWLNFRLETYEYNLTHHLIQSQSSTWDSENSLWIYGQQYQYFPDGNDRDTLQITRKWNVLTSEWDYQSRKKRQFDPDGKMTEEINQFWNKTSQAWINTSRILYLSDALGRDTLILSQNWNDDNSTWNDKTRTANFYDEKDLLVRFTLAQWEIASQTWVYTRQGFYTYDKEGDPIEYILQNWNENEEWENSIRFRYVYKKVLDVPEITHNEYINCKWSHPSTGTICFTCNGLTEGLNYVICLVSFEGKVISDRVIKGGQHFCIQHPPLTGLYLLTIRDRKQLIFSTKLFIP